VCIGLLCEYIDLFCVRIGLFCAYIGLVCVCTGLFCVYIGLICVCIGLLCVYPQTEEIGLEIITTAKISNNFSQESPYISSTFSREFPKFRTGFHLS